MARNLYYIEQTVCGLRQQVGDKYTDKSHAHRESRRWVREIKNANPDRAVHTRGSFIKDGKGNAGDVMLFVDGRPVLTWTLIAVDMKTTG